MLIRFFKQNHPVSLFIMLPIISILLWIPGIIHPAEYINTKYSMPLFELMIQIVGQHSLLLLFIGLLFMYFTALVFNHFINKMEAFESKSNIPGLVFVLLASSFTNFLTFHPLQPASLFFLLALARIFNSYQQNGSLSYSFDAGLLTGLSILCYLPFFWFMPLIWVCLLIIRPFVWREYLLSALGALLPFVFTASGYFLLGNLDALWYDKIVFPLSERSFPPVPNAALWWMLILWGGLLLLIAIGPLFKRLSNTVIKAANIIQSIIMMLFFSCFIIFINGTHHSYIYYILAIPLSLFLGNYFVSQKKAWLSELLLSVFVLLIIFNQYFS
jgi:hypothetical protein